MTRLRSSLIRPLGGITEVEFWNWIWVNFRGELPVVAGAPFLFVLCVIIGVILSSCVMYRTLVVRFRQLLQKKEGEIELLKSEILMLKVRLASR
jgi:hypothetical protein